MAKRIQTAYGPMLIEFTRSEVEAMDRQDCIDWLEFNDRNGCYSDDDATREFGEPHDLETLRVLVFTISNED